MVPFPSQTPMDNDCRSYFGVGDDDEICVKGLLCLHPLLSVVV